MPHVAQPSQPGAVKGGSTGHARSRASEVFVPPVHQRVSGPAFEGHHVRNLIGHGSARPPVSSIMRPLLPDGRAATAVSALIDSRCNPAGAMRPEESLCSS